jgi:hypothetical protein
MSEFYEKNAVLHNNMFPQVSYGNSTAINNFSYNGSAGNSVYYSDGDIQSEIKAFRDEQITQLVNEISILIRHDEFLDGEISQSEMFMEEAYANNQMEYVIEALMQIYYANLLNVHVLEGVLVMLASVPYEAVETKGPIMAIGLLSNKELIIRDRAIQCFERWNSKKGLIALKSLDCHPKWLQNYVNKVIMYIERDGID